MLKLHVCLQNQTCMLKLFLVCSFCLFESTCCIFDRKKGFRVSKEFRYAWLRSGGSAANLRMNRLESTTCRSVIGAGVDPRVMAGSPLLGNVYGAIWTWWYNHILSGSSDTYIVIVSTKPAHNVMLYSFYVLLLKSRWFYEWDIIFCSLHERYAYA